MGSGEWSVFLWLDNWHTLGPLFQKLGGIVVLNLGRSLSAKVASIIHGDTWRRPRPRNAVTQSIVDHTPASLVHNNQTSDRLNWIPDNSDKYTSPEPLVLLSLGLT